MGGKSWKAKLKILNLNFRAKRKGTSKDKILTKALSILKLTTMDFHYHFSLGFKIKYLGMIVLRNNFIIMEKLRFIVI